MKNSFSPEQPDAQTLLNQLVLEYRQEQKRKRFWRWIKRVLIILLIIILYFKISHLTDDHEQKSAKDHAGLIDLKGNIFDTTAGNAENFAKGLESAYKKKGMKALIIRINSPGGSPVQADYMFNSLRYYRQKYPNIKIYAVCVDICASAAYYVAAAADEIYANPSSMVGSIGVLYNGFGFVDALQKLGISRRLQTAGRYKALLDPFSPNDPQGQQVVQGMLQDVHQVFIDKVRLGRGSRLKIDEDTFSGLFWTGQQAIKRGLIDGFASSGQLAREQLKLPTIIEYTYEQTVLERMSKGIGMALADSLPQALGLYTGIRA